MGDAGRTHQFVRTEAHGDGASIAHGVARIFDELAQKPCAVLQAAAIFIAAAVHARLQEMRSDAQTVSRIDIDDVEAGAFGADRGIAVPAAQIENILLVHGPRLDGRVINHGTMRGSDGDLARAPIGAGGAMMHQLDGGERTMLMNGIGHGGQSGDIRIGP